MFNFKGMFEISPRWLNRNTADKVTEAYTYRHTGNTHRAWSKHLWDVLFLKHKIAKRELEEGRGKTFMPAWKTRTRTVYFALLLLSGMQRQQNWLTYFFIALAFYHLSYLLWEYKWFLSLFVCARVLHMSVTSTVTFACVCLQPY